MPRNRLGKPVSAAPYNCSDGFSPGNMIVTKVPGLDTPEAFARTGAVPITDIERSFDPDQPIVVINARTLERQLIWSELDANPADPRDVTLIVRPAVNFDEGERYIVALRNLRDAQGRILNAQPAFRALRDRKPDPAGRGAPRPLRAAVRHARAGRHQAQGPLPRLGLHRGEPRGPQRPRAPDPQRGVRGARRRRPRPTSCPRAASRSSSPNPDLPDDLPDEAEADGRRDLGDSIRISGNISVPCFLNAPGCPPGSEFDSARTACRSASRATRARERRLRDPEDAAAGPLRPRSTATACSAAPARSAGANVRAMANEHGFVFCATDWAGMSTLDVPNVLALLQDLSRFPTLADRAQQGFVNFMYVGRWMLKRDWGDVDVDQSRLFYDGNSQGGIMGGALTALAPDFDRAVLGVPGMNYSTLLRRSVDFDLYAHGNIEGADTPLGLYDAYPNELERPLLLSLIQLLWDRGEANGYAHHITDDPLPGTPAHNVLMHVAFARPPGGERDRRGRGAHDRRVGALAGARARAATPT